MGKRKPHWFWETCPCKRHGRLVLEGRSDFSFECGSIDEALSMLHATMLRDKLDEATAEALYTQIRQSGLPQEVLGIDGDLRLPLEIWNKVHDEIMDTNAPYNDPAQFHELAPRLMAGGMKSVH